MIASSKLISLSFLFFGIFMLMQVIFPIISFQIWELGQKYNHSLLISPQRTDNKGILGVSIQNKDNFSGFFSTLKREVQPDYSTFSLSIPKVNIKNALVEVDSNDLSKNLAQLPGSALPGEKGNLFITGHSSLSPLLSIKKAIFATLLDLKKGDQIIVSAGGVKFVYQVIDLKVVDPSDISVISPPNGMGRYISLMTCVPPGLNLKRLIVIGEII